MKMRLYTDLFRRAVHLVFVLVLAQGCLFASVHAAGAYLEPIAASGVRALSEREYTFGYWLNGLRKHKDDHSKDTLVIESGYYGFTLNLADLTEVQFGRFAEAVDYEAGLRLGAKRIDLLADGEWALEIEVGERVYRAAYCKASGRAPQQKRSMKHAWLWESARWVQHYELHGITFVDGAGDELVSAGSIAIVAWPDSLNFTARLKFEPRDVGVLEDVKIRMRLQGAQVEDVWGVEKTVQGKWEAEQVEELTLNCELEADHSFQDAVTVKVATSPEGAAGVEYRHDYNAYVSEVWRSKRGWKTGYRDIRDYDDFDVTVENRSDRAINVPFMLYLRNPAQITGMVPMLCDENGVPTGIPVQLSKNWHYRQLGAYFRGYVKLPAQPGTTKYKFRIAYGFYGSVPSASHAQLSLVGYGGLGRWDQLAIGCWGETICFDMDMSCVDIAITDVRMLMARNGKDGNKWGWTDAGWGGDWLNVKDAAGRKHYFSEMKTAYHSHGPCLTEVHYDGNYGSQREVDADVRVHTLRTDDYARTFQKFEYVFNQRVSIGAGWLFKMGRTGGYVTPRVAYGNRDGLLREHQVSAGIQQGEVFLNQYELTGEAPWWVSFPGAYHHRTRDWGTGYRALVVRAYRAVIGGQEYLNPTITFSAHSPSGEGLPNLDCLLTAPEGVSEFNVGDRVEFAVEWITLPRVADDYYGPNEVFRAHVAGKPSSWETTYREAIVNDLKVDVEGGSVVQKYPIIIDVEQAEVEFVIQGGVGYVPVSFRGLERAEGCTLYRIVDGERQVLDQSVHGNDFWQTDYDAKSSTFKVSYNLSLDDVAQSTWVFAP